MNVRARLGENTRRRRLELGMSQEDLAAVAELDRTYVSGIERGIRNPSLEVLARLAGALNISIGELTD